MKVYVESKDLILETWTGSCSRMTHGNECANTEVQLAVLEVDYEE